VEKSREGCWRVEKSGRERCVLTRAPHKNSQSNDPSMEREHQRSQPFVTARMSTSISCLSCRICLWERQQTSSWCSHKILKDRRKQTWNFRRTGESMED
jgi:hypothetical protein